MKINIILPFFLKKPGGGLKVMYEYANRLNAQGYDIKIYHCCKLAYTYKKDIADWKILFKYYIKNIILNNNRRPQWFPLNDKIACKNIPFINDAYVRDADFIFTTWWATALECSKLSKIKGDRINFIQGYENWLGYEDLLHESYNILGQTNIVISTYLYNKVCDVSTNRLEIIPNSIDTKQFYIKSKINKRKPASITLMYSTQELKGSLYALRALNILKNKYTDLDVHMFSVYDKPEGLPNWIHFYKNSSDLCSIYNNSAIFLSTSLEEGWGLTPMESIASGCACVATDIPGHKEFLENGINSLLVPTKDIQEIVKKISYLIDNDDYRIYLAEAGQKSIATKYSWDKAICKLENILKD